MTPNVKKLFIEYLASEVQSAANKNLGNAETQSISREMININNHSTRAKSRLDRDIYLVQQAIDCPLAARIDKDQAALLIIQAVKNRMVENSLMN